MKTKLPWITVLGILALLCAPLAVDLAWAATVGPSANQNPNYQWDSNPNDLTGATSGFAPAGRTTATSPTSVTVLNDLTVGLGLPAPGNPTMTATGYNGTACAAAPCPTDLTAYKTSGVDEHGLGFVNDPNPAPGNFEIFDTRFIQANVTQILAAGFILGELRVQSVQGPETYSVFGSNTAGVPGALLLTGELPAVSDLYIDLPGWGSFNFYSVFADGGLTTAPSNNVLFDAIGATPVPEPGTILLLGSGLIGFVLYRRRKA